MTFCRHPEPFKGEGSSKVLVMKNNWMLRCAQHDEMRECMIWAVILNGCEGSSEVLRLLECDWMLRLRLSMTRVSRRIWRYTAVGL